MKGRRKSSLFVSLAMGIFAFSVYTDVSIAAPDGICTPGSAEQTTYQCGNFDGNVIEFDKAEPVAGGCVTNIGIRPCTRYDYKYTGSSTGQIVNLISTDLVDGLNFDPVAVNCNQLLEAGVGDPTTNFGVNILTHVLCRIPQTGTSLAPFSIFADPSSPTNPLAWQIKVGKSATAALVLGPTDPNAPIVNSGGTVTALDGSTVSYSNVGGTVTILEGDARVLEADQVFLCIENEGVIGDPVFPDDYTCDVVFFVDGDPNVQVGPNSTCIKYIGRTPFAYNC